MNAATGTWQLRRVIIRSWAATWDIPGEIGLFRILIAVRHVAFPIPG